MTLLHISQLFIQRAIQETDVQVRMLHKLVVTWCTSTIKYNENRQRKNRIQPVVN